MAYWTNDRAVVDQGSPCINERRNGLTDMSVFAKKIDYAFSKKGSEDFKKKNSASSSQVKRGLLVAVVLGSAFEE